MDIQFYGANCIVLTTKQARVVIDDNLAELGAKSVTKEGDLVLFTAAVHGEPAKQPKLLIDEPGEYEVSGVSVFGIAARGHMETEDEGKHAVMYKLVADDVSVLVTGHLYPELSEAQLESIGTIDVMLVPVGNSGYTLDGIGALKLIKKVEPKLAVPTHFEEDGLNYPVPQQPLAEAIKALAMEPKETLPKLKVKPHELSDSTQLVILERS